MNKSIEALHSGDCLRAVVHINDYNLAAASPVFKQVSNTKVNGGFLKQIKHQSACNDCEMTFSVFMPAQKTR